MTRTKNSCRGFNKDGTKCNNWALRGSFYCQLHQHQFSKKDSEDQKTVNNYSSIFLTLLIIFLFLLSILFGCEKEFFNWMSH